MQISRSSLLTGAAILLVLSGSLTLLPLASAQSTVMVSIPRGSGVSSAAAPGFSPHAITVVVGVNNTVTWMNNDNASHTVTPENVPSPGSWSVGSGNLAAAQSYSFTFTVPGTYNYTCSYHSWMSGSIVVKGVATTSTATSVTTSTTPSTTTSTTTKTSTTPEFPTAALGATLFVIMAALVLLAPRLRTSAQQKPGLVP
jgi:plastocyanin